MLWLQTLPAALLWLAFIFVRRNWMQSPAHGPRPRRIALMLGSVVLSLGALFGGFLLLTSQSWLAANGSLTGIGVAFVAIMGLLFLHFQMLALRLTLSLAFERETPTPAPASEPADNSGESK